MPNVELDQDVLDYVERQAKGFGETPSSVLRRLLGMGEQSQPVKTPAAEQQQASQPHIRPVTQPEHTISPATKHPRCERTAIQRYLSILSELYREDPTLFEKVETVRGRKRIYFHKSSLAIDSSGSSVMPERIPDTPYFAATNISDDKKKRILSDVLKALGVHGTKRTECLICLDPDHVDPGFNSPLVDLDDCI
jgi:negative modulator of initiation of replication